MTFGAETGPLFVTLDAPGPIAVSGLDRFDTDGWGPLVWKRARLAIARADGSCLSICDWDARGAAVYVSTWGEPTVPYLDDEPPYVLSSFTFIIAYS